MRYVGRKLLFFIIILIPFWSFLVWFFWPKETVKTLILDKTVLTASGEEHRSLNWVLTHEKFTKPSGSQYDIADDYYGFFPVNRPEYQIKDLTPFSRMGLDSMAGYYDAVYFTDAYGIYQNEWYKGRDINERSPKVYGGLFNQDYLFMAKMFRQRKLLLSEFNTIASPTPIRVRENVENLLGIDFSGWTGRYYHSLDTLENPDIPRWMRRLHERYYDRKFDFEDIPGIVLIHETEKIVVLELEKHLRHEVPIINTPPVYQEKYNVPDYVRYPFWFDITFSQNPDNVYATYKLHTNERGDSSLGFHHIPKEFPAVIGDLDESLKYYFCGDFSDNPIPFGLAYFKGVEYLRKLFYNNTDPLDRKKFFWEYYRPMVTKIIDDYLLMEREGKIDRDTLRPIERYPKYVRFYRRYGYRRPQIGDETDRISYNPNTVYGSDIRNSAIFSEESEYDEEIPRDDEGNPIFLRDVEEAPSEEEAEEQRKKEFEAEQDRLAVQRRKRREAEQRKQDSINAYNQKVRAEKPAQEEKEKEEIIPEASETREMPSSAKPSRYHVGGRKMNYSAPKAVPMQKETPPADKQEEEPAEQPEEQEEVKPKPVETPPSTPRQETGSTPAMTAGWKVVLASLDNRTAAQEFVAARNLDARVVYVSKVNSYRVVLGNFNNLREAQTALNEVQATYPKAWIANF